MTSSSATTTATTAASSTNQASQNFNQESAIYDYMKQFVDYQEYAVDLPELSQIRQMDMFLQSCYESIRELVSNLREKQYGTDTESEIQTKLISSLIQAKALGDRKMQLSQQMLDTTERQSKKLKIAHQKYIESINQQSTSAEHPSNENDSDQEYDSEAHPTRTLSNKISTTSLWKRKTTTTTATVTTASSSANNSSASTISLKRKCVISSEQNNDPRDRKKTAQRNANYSAQGAHNGTSRKLKLNNDSSSTHSDEPTYCLCSQLSYGSMILCDSKACEIKWFHFNCVNLSTKPKGKWFCPNCR